jgi:hypothetical protein
MRRVECDLWTCAANTLLLRGDLRTPYCTSSVLLPATPSMYNCTYIPTLPHLLYLQPHIQAHQATPTGELKTGTGVACFPDSP